MSRPSDAAPVCPPSWISAGVHLCGAAAFVFTRAAEGLHYRILPADVPWRTGPPWWVVFAYVVCAFAFYAAADAVVDRPLARRRGQTWSWRRWAARTADHGVPFVVGSCLIVMTQVLFERWWFAATAAALLVLFALTHAVRDTTSPGDDGEGDAATWRTMLLAYAWALAGLGVSTAIIPGRLVGTATYVGWLMLTMSAWTMLTVPAALRFAATRSTARHALRLAAWTPQLLWRNETTPDESRPVGS